MYIDSFIIAVEDYEQKQIWMNILEKILGDNLEDHFYKNKDCDYEHETNEYILIIPNRYTNIFEEQLEVVSHLIDNRNEVED